MSTEYGTTRDGVIIYCKDWGPKSAQPIVFHHGWPPTLVMQGNDDQIVPYKDASLLQVKLTQ